MADDFTTTLATHGSHATSGVFSAASTPVVTLPELVVGSAIQGSVDAVLMAPSPSAARNLLGMDVLKRHCCHFKFEDRALIIDVDQLSTATRPLTMDPVSHPYVEVSWQDTIAQCVWDSGAGITVVDKGFWLAHQDMFEEVGKSFVTDGNGVQVETPTFLMAEVEIGGELFARHKVALVDLSQANATLDRPMDLLLGYTTLNQANWLFDFPAKRWSVTRRYV